MKVLHNTHVNITNEHMGLSPFYSRVASDKTHCKPFDCQYLSNGSTDKPIEYNAKSLDKNTI